MDSALPRLRDVRPGDEDWLLELRFLTMDVYFENAGEPLSRQQHLDRIRQAYSAIRIIELDGVDVGMIKVIREAALWHLAQMQLLPEHQNRGIGTRLIEALLAEARDAEVPVTLQVLKVNPARALYARLGFEVVDDLGHSYEMRAVI